MPSFTVESWWADHLSQGDGGSGADKLRAANQAAATEGQGGSLLDQYAKYGIASAEDGAEGASGSRSDAGPKYGSGPSMDLADPPRLRLRLGLGGGVALGGGASVFAGIEMDPGNITDSLALYYEGGVTGGVKAGITFGNLSYGNTDTGVDFQIRAAGNLGPLQSRVGLLSGNDLNLRFNFQGNAGLGVGAGVDAIGSVRINFASAVNTFGRMFLGWMMSQGLPVSGFGN